MAPKKKDAKKGGKGGGGAELEELKTAAANNFVKKGYPDVSAAYNIAPLALQYDRGEEGTQAFMHLAVHPGLAGKTQPDPKAPECTPIHCRALLEALAPYAYLVRLAFWSVPVKDEGCAAIGAYLAGNKTVTSLDVTDAGISRVGCKALGEALERNATLQTLRLDHNRGIGPEGVQVLGESLVKNLCLATLSLTFCGLEGEGAASAFCHGPMQAPALRVLELKGNRFGAEGALLLLRALRTCASLFRIDLADTGWGMHPEVIAAVEECFETNTTCHEYALGHNPIGDTTVYRWLGLVKKLEHLIFVDVSNKCDPLLFKQIGDATANNKKAWLKRQKKKGGKKGKKKK